MHLRSRKIRPKPMVEQADASFGKKSSSSKFLELPREIRDEVYFYTLLSRAQYQWQHHQTYVVVAEWPVRPQKPTSTQSSLFRTSHRVHEEATSVLYHRFTLFFCNPVHNFWSLYCSFDLCKISDAFRFQMQNVGFWCHLPANYVPADHPGKVFEETLEFLPSLKNMTIVTPIYGHRSEHRDPEWLEETASNLLKAFQAFDRLDRVHIRLLGIGPKYRTIDTNNMTAQVVYEALVSRVSSNIELKMIPADSQSICAK